MDRCNALRENGPFNLQQTRDGAPATVKELDKIEVGTKRGMAMVSGLFASEGTRRDL